MRIVHFIATLLLIVLANCSRPPQRQYEFALPSAAGLKDKGAIAFRGIQVGYITNIRLSSDGSGAVVATGVITNAQMRVLHRDTARVITVALLSDPQIEIVRASDSAAELPVGSTITVATLPSALTVLTDILDMASELRRLPPDKQKEVAAQIRAVIDAAKAGSTNSATTDSR